MNAATAVTALNELAAVAYQLQHRVVCYYTQSLQSLPEGAGQRLTSIAARLGCTKFNLECAARHLEGLPDQELEGELLQDVSKLWDLHRRMCANPGSLMSLLRGEYPPIMKDMFQALLGGIVPTTLTVPRNQFPPFSEPLMANAVPNSGGLTAEGPSSGAVATESTALAPSAGPLLTRLLSEGEEMSRTFAELVTSMDQFFEGVGHMLSA